MTLKLQRGFSVFEILVVVTLFVVIVTVANQAFFTSLQGQNKSQATTNTKQNADFVASFMDRSLHSAQRIASCDSNTIVYLDGDGKQQTIACSSNNITYSGTSLITSSVTVSQCSLSCVAEGGTNTVVIDMSFAQAGTNLRVDQSSTTQIQTRIRLRN